MNILVVSQCYSPDPFCVGPICESLVKKGHSVTVITGLPNVNSNCIFPGESFLDGVKVIRVYVSRRKKGLFSLLHNYLSFYRNSRKVAKKMNQKFDLVFSFVLSPIIAAFGALIVSKKQRIPHIHYCLDLWPASVVSVYPAIAKIPFAYSILLKISKKVYLSCKHIIVSSPSFSSYLINTIGCAASGISYIPQPIRSETEIRPAERYSHKLNLVYGGNIGSLQMVERLVAVANLLVGRFDFAFHICGSGSRLDNVLNLIKTNHLESTVIYHGSFKQNEIGAFYRNATGLFMALDPNRGVVSETAPNKLVSYLSYGKPIVVIARGDGQKIALDSGGCLCSADPSPESIANQITQLFKLSEEQREEMGTRNLKYYKEHFGFSGNIERIESVLTSVK